jgi:putative transposase
MILAHKICLDPTCKQRNQLAKAAGCARYAWNWALERCEKHYAETGKLADLNALKVEWNRCKPVWTYESPKDANQQVFANLKKAYTRFFKRVSARPRFKTKHSSKDSFYVSNDQFRLDGLRVRLPKIGRVKLREELRFKGKIMSATVSRTADRWFLSVAVDTFTEEKHGEEVIGVDVGLKHFATLSTGEVIEAPLPLKGRLKVLRRLSRRHSRKAKGGQNRKKSAQRLAKLHYRVSTIRQDFLHKVTTMLVSRAKTIVIEDLTLAGMRKLWGRKISDLGLYEFRRQLEYKCLMRGVDLVIADRFYPSTQLCSNCGSRKKMTLETRVYSCPVCDSTIDRDLNASINLRTLGLRGNHACGHQSSDGIAVKPRWSKQELTPCSLVNTI